MKLIKIFLLLCVVLFSVTVSRRVTRRHRTHRGVLSNSWAFAVGAIGTFIGQPNLDPNNVAQPIAQCLSAFTASNPSQENDGFTYVQNSNNIIRQVINFSYTIAFKTFSADTIVGFLCQFQDTAISIFGGRRFRRRFFATKSSTRKVQVLRKALKKVLKNEKRKRFPFQDAIVNAIKPIFSNFQAFIVKYLQGIPLIKNIIDAFKCLKGLAVDVMNTVKRRVANLTAAVNLVLTQGWKGFIKVLIKTVCNWDSFKTAINNLLDALANNGATKWTLFGRAAGGIFATIGDVNF